MTAVAANADFAGCAAFAATKAGLEASNRVAREEMRSRGICVGVSAPRATDSEVWPAETASERSRMCRVEDIASAIRVMLEVSAEPAWIDWSSSPPTASFEVVLRCV